ncbi:hypothetical protein DdX_21517 [Ditylenchus destructor]|uniref:Uncharacterized protein n=1 Tax=Ditylenchus destructor TaxID=166010 RepID=A0AAD4MIY0_9BILA|nr:hypothetical protein DdX_21517 [Ditylenchus destructor]
MGVLKRIEDVLGKRSLDRISETRMPARSCMSRPITRSVDTFLTTLTQFESPFCSMMRSAVSAITGTTSHATRSSHPRVPPSSTTSRCRRRYRVFARWAMPGDGPLDGRLERIVAANIVQHRNMPERNNPRREAAHLVSRHDAVRLKGYHTAKTGKSIAIAIGLSESDR